MPERRNNGERTLQHVNEQLAELLHVDPLPLTEGGARALDDALWVWGVVGGKNVGKSTLINALAGAVVVERGDGAGEGTFSPTAYLCADDQAALQARFAGLAGMEVSYHAAAPGAMRRLVLVDLPDFDSLFEGHIETVRRMAGVLDGVIWVTTPKKVGDLRAIREIRRVLKARMNFTYVVNKMDWLLAQSQLPPPQEFDRAHRALLAQIDSEQQQAATDNAFFIAARYRTRDAILDAIAASRKSDTESAANGALTEAASQLAANFDRLRETLTTPPTVEAIQANKEANLRYQLQTQAKQLRRHFQIAFTLKRLERALNGDALAELEAHYFPPAYTAGLVRRINRARSLFAEWSMALFKRRIGYWSMLGMIAWPLALAGAALGGLRSLVPTGVAAQEGDPFRGAGVSLRERVEGLRAGVQSRLAGLTERLDLALPEVEGLETRFRRDVLDFQEQRRAALLDALLAKKPGFAGRALRRLVPVVIVLWFSLVQPLLAAGLAAFQHGMAWDVALLSPLVEALAAGKILAGLCVALLLLAGMAAAVYSRSVRDSFAALDALREADDDSSEPLTSVLLRDLIQPAEALRRELVKLDDHLGKLCGEAVFNDDGN